MVATILLAAAALVGQPGDTPAGVDRVDVAYEELAEGRASAAIERIRANRELEADDPAALINLAAAYAMMGDKEKAADCYRAAMASSERYDLELADGSWMDSRRLARTALADLLKSERMASR